MRNGKLVSLFQPPETVHHKRGSKTQSGRGKVISVGGVVFRSDFECGNLENVRLVAANTYVIDLER